MTITWPRGTSGARLGLRVGLVLALGLTSACGGNSSARLNPFNWFRGSQERVVLYPDGGFGARAELRPLVDQVTEMRVERVSDGAVVRATGLPPVQGYWDGELVSPDDLTPVNGRLTLEFRIRPPVDRTAVSVPRSREVTVAFFLSHQKLEGVREVLVVAARNQRSARR
jgi:hypothetical protein